MDTVGEFPSDLSEAGCDAGDLETARIARAAFPKGHRYMRMRETLGSIYEDGMLVALFPCRGQPADAPWRLALITVLPCGFNVTRALQDVPVFAPREKWAALPAVQQQRVYVVDAKAYTTQSGPRLVRGLARLAEMFRPACFSTLISAGGAHAAVRRTAQGAPPGLTSAAVSPHHLTASRRLVEQTQAT